MRTLYAVYRKEMGHYFVSPIAYVVVGLFLILCAFFFNYYLASVSEQIAMQGRYGMPPEVDVPGEVLRAFLGLIATLILFFTPMLTMGVYAEEKKRGTMELLMTSPVTDVAIVLGKFLASVSLFIIMLLPTASYVAIMNLRSDPVPPWRLLFAGYLGVLLLGGALLALGTFVSSLTENQIIAAVLTFGALLFIWVLDIGRNAGGVVGPVLQYLSLIRHYEDFTRGIIDTTGLIYYASFIFLFVFLTVRSLDSMRWRRA
ncbi:MAG: ABC transporter permease [Candidatus Acidiferrales bacterium]